MKRAGQIVLFKFPQTDLALGKLRPALLLGKLPGQFGDYLICLISSQLRHCIEEFDEVIGPDDSDFIASGLKEISVIRIGRLAVVGEEILLGAIGKIDSERLNRIKTRLARWLVESDD
jgi:mRNA interferase MazF